MIDFGTVLLFAAIIMPFTTVFFALFRGENNYYDSDDYDGNGTAH